MDRISMKSNGHGRADERACIDPRQITVVTIGLGGQQKETLDLDAGEV